ncbi:MAG TPA: cbb3-type cytochrome c oxidase subunit 3 [Usitatibacteraceae bacterium]|nr:cbb3-type cytochrome c oxidase subunit 3 [Usitatibacteraceae bacterium]
MLEDLRVTVTVVSFLTFLGIVLWAVSARRQRRFDRAARQPIEDCDLPPIDSAPNPGARP